MEKKKRGRPLKYDHKQDESILVAWQTGSYLDFKALGNAFEMYETQITKAIDRARKARKALE